MSQPPDPGGWPDPSPPPDRPSPGQPSPPPPFYQAPGPPGYGQVPPSPGYGYPPPLPRQNSLAVGAMVVSIASAALLLCAICFSLLAVVPLGGGVTGTILGSVARRQIRERGERGDGMALAGIIVGLVAAVLGALALVATVISIGYNIRSL